MSMTYAQMPEPKNIPPGMEDFVLHASIQIGDTNLLASDGPIGCTQPMRSAYLMLTLDSTPEAERIYAVLSESGEVIMPIQETFFACRFAMLRDKFGISWMIRH
jgi:PhnB protein